MSRVMNLTILFIVLTIASIQVSRSESSLNGRSSNTNRNGSEYHASTFFDDGINDNPDISIRLWPNGLVYFKIADEFEDQQTKYIYRAMIEICRMSCVCFLPAEKNMKTYVLISEDEHGCMTDIGYKEGVSHLFLHLDPIDSGDFTLGTIKRELLHVIGLIPEQNAPNRDKYVRIIYDNIDKEHWHNFKKWRTDDLPYGVFPYDFNSIMHSPLGAYSKNGMRTIVPFEDLGDAVIGHATTFSQLDIQKVNAIYNCTCVHY